MPFGQVVLGPPGAGKTVYCHGMQQFLRGVDRKTAVVNLDPANEQIPYDCAVDVADLISIEDVMNAHDLGPNGALIFCLEFLEKNVDWLLEKLAPFKDANYFLFDLPGQVELYTHHDSLRRVLDVLQRQGFRLTVVHLVDSFYCSAPGHFIAACALSLSAMLQLEMPHVNVLSKVDLIEKFGRLKASLAVYTDASDLESVVDMLEGQPGMKKYEKLSRALAEVIVDFGLVSFETLNIQDKESVLRLLKVIDRANGCSYSGALGPDSEFKRFMLDETDFSYFHVGEVQEKYLDAPADSEPSFEEELVQLGKEPQ